MTVCVAMGTRPSIIKMQPIVRVLKERKIDYFVLHTGQHDSRIMSEIFLEQLGLLEPRYWFFTGPCESHGEQISIMLSNADHILNTEKPDIVLACGDDNTCLSVALAARKSDLMLGHVESGLRSYDWRMPEEHNRIVVDHISDLLFAPTNASKQNLISENIHGKIFVTGNTVVDIVQEMLAKTNEFPTPFENFILVTAHRQENIDNPRILKELVDAILESPLPIVFPAHPRTIRRIIQLDLYRRLTKSSNVCLLDAIGYLEFLSLLKQCTLVWTDSGGVQEEATVAKKRTVVMRITTDRPEAVKEGFAAVAGVKKTGILTVTERLLNETSQLPKNSPFGDGTASQQIIDIVEEVSK